MRAKTALYLASSPLDVSVRTQTAEWTVREYQIQFKAAIQTSKRSVIDLQKPKLQKLSAHPGNRTLVSTVGGYYDTTTPDALWCYYFFGVWYSDLQKQKTNKKKEGVEKWGIDPHTSRMLSERSTI